MYRALLVEDDRDLSVITQTNLSHAGYSVDAAYDCAQALVMFHTNSYDLVLLDSILPDMRGDELCRRIRAVCSCPIIFVSCLDDSGVIVKSLRSGADDYMVKPIDYKELLARAEAITRRSHRVLRPDDGVIRFRSFQIDTDSRTVTSEGTLLDLSGIEYEMLLYMTQHPGELLLYQQIYEQVWGSDSLGDFRTVMVHISKLRRLVDPHRRGIIETVRGAGYIFTDA